MYANDTVENVLIECRHRSSKCIERDVLNGTHRMCKYYFFYYIPLLFSSSLSSSYSHTTTSSDIYMIKDLVLDSAILQGQFNPLAPFLACSFLQMEMDKNRG
jgi:hypothetical protein